MTEDIYQRFKELKQRKNWKAHDEMMDPSFQQEVLRSGDPEFIAEYFHTIEETEDTVIEHFGRDSVEHLAYQRRASDLEALLMKKGREYIVPKLTENPAATKGMAKRWIWDFCKANNLSLPKGFHSRTEEQVVGMFHGMRRYYGISLDDTIID